MRLCSPSVGNSASVYQRRYSKVNMATPVDTNYFFSVSTRSAELIHTLRDWACPWLLAIENQQTPSSKRQGMGLLPEERLGVTTNALMVPQHSRQHPPGQPPVPTKGEQGPAPQPLGTSVQEILDEGNK